MRLRPLVLACLCALVASIPVFALPQAFSKHVVSDTHLGPYWVRAADLNEDGYVDLLTAGYRSCDIAWWESDGGSPPLFTEHTIHPEFRRAPSVHPADIDGDGHIDVVAAGLQDGRVAWWENDGQGNFTEHAVSESFDGARSVYVADLDADGDMDLLGSARDLDSIAWWENDGSQSFTQHLITDSFDGANRVYAADVDGDGDVDVLGTANVADDIAWFENVGGTPVSFTPHTIDDDFGRAACVYAIDLDQDGDVDVLGTAEDDAIIAWFENTGTQPTCFVEHIIKADFAGAYGLHVADVDLDQDLDVLGTALLNDHVTWFENTGGTPLGFTEHLIDDGLSYPQSVYATDLDGDGDTDVMATAYEGDEISWWENLQDFSMSSPAPHQTLLPGNEATFDVAVTSENGFCREVELGIDDLPSGWQEDIHPNLVTPTGTSDLTITLPVTSTAGTYPMHVVGTAGVVTRSITLTIDVQTFTISSPSPPQTIFPGESVSYTLTLTSKNGFNESVSLSADGLPSECHAILDPNPALPPCQSILTIECAIPPPIGPHIIAVSGEVDSLRRDADVVLLGPYRASLPLAVRYRPHWWDWWSATTR
jgi:hypothetical protein